MASALAASPAGASVAIDAQHVTVTGLVLAGSGINPIHQFEATVSCIGADGLPRNVSTGGFAATVPGGNSHLTATVELPRAHPLDLAHGRAS